MSFKKVKKKIYKIKEKIRLVIKTYIIRDELYLIRNQFKADNVKFNYRYDYPLNKDSIVIDAGGYLGDWAERIFNLYGSKIFVFEPVEEYCDEIEKKLNNDKVKVFRFGLADKDYSEDIFLEGDASSVYRGKGKKVTVHFRDIVKVLEELDISNIDLIKMNIEGGEYNLLQRMIDEDLIKICKDLQIQFHHFYPNSEELRSKIRVELLKTHKTTYDYKFCFENYRKI
jgi:FkbM family methyltransferase